MTMLDAIRAAVGTAPENPINPFSYDPWDDDSVDPTNLSDQTPVTSTSAVAVSNGAPDTQVVPATDSERVRDFHEGDLGEVHRLFDQAGAPQYAQAATRLTARAATLTPKDTL